MNTMMKWMALTVAAGMLLAGCSSDSAGDDMLLNGAAHEVTVNIAFGGDISDTRTRTRAAGATTFIPSGEDAFFVEHKKTEGYFLPPREMDCTNNWQQVNSVRVYLFKKGGADGKKGEKYYYYRPLTPGNMRIDYLDASHLFSKKFETDPTAYWTGGDAVTGMIPEFYPMEEQTLSVRPLLENGEYRFLAIARDDADVAAKILSDPNSGTDAWVPDVTSLDDASSLTLSSLDPSHAATGEFFSGVSKTVRVTSYTREFTVEVECSRRVAGLLLYIENLPTEMEMAWNYTPAGGVTIAKGTKHAVNRLAVASASTLTGAIILPLEKENTPLYYPHSADMSAGTEPFSASYIFVADLNKLFTVRDGMYVDDMKTNRYHYNTVIAGGFIFPQPAPSRTAVTSDTYDDTTFAASLDKSLYLLFMHYDDGTKQTVVVDAKPIRMLRDNLGNAYTDFKYPLRANRIYSIGELRYSPDGKSVEVDNPINMQHIEDVIISESEWQADVDINFD